MKTLVVSDTHLNSAFDLRKFSLLLHLISNCDRLIVNGDFWSCYSTSFTSFINSRWNELFPLMRAKKTIYLYGNHDRREFMDDRVNLFSLSQETKLEYKTKNSAYHIEHGNLFFRHQSTSNPVVIQAGRLLKVDRLVRRPINNYFYNTFGIKPVIRALGFMNRHIKAKGQAILKENKVLVTGHTHQPESDFDHGFFNTGFIDYGFASYLEIGDQGPKLQSRKY